MSEDDDLQETLSSLCDDISSLNQKFREYVKLSNEQTRRRRVENLHTLIALGILGGFITALSQGLISSSSYTLLLWIFSIASAGYLLGKIITITLQPVTDNRWINTIDGLIIPFLYMTSIIGISLGLIGNIILNRIAISFPQISPGILSAVTALAVFVIAVTAAKRYAVEYQEASREQEERAQRVAGTSCEKRMSTPGKFFVETYATDTPGQCRINTRQESHQVVEIDNLGASNEHVYVKAESEGNEIEILSDDLVRDFVQAGQSVRTQFTIQQASDSPQGGYDMLRLDVFYSARDLDELDESRLHKICTLSPALSLTQ